MSFKIKFTVLTILSYEFNVIVCSDNQIVVSIAKDRDEIKKKKKKKKKKKNF